MNIVDVNPELLEKMQNNPQAAKEYTQRLKNQWDILQFSPIVPNRKIQSTVFWQQSFLYCALWCETPG